MRELLSDRLKLPKQWPAMGLRRQLLLVSLLLLSLPWAGCQFVREMEGSLRQGQEQSLLASARAIAAVIAQDESLLYPDPTRRRPALDEARPLYAFPATGPVLVDGYGDGWEAVPARRFAGTTENGPLAVAVQAQTREGYLYLLFRVTDSQVIYHNPGLSEAPNGDRLVLRLWRNHRRQDFVIATSAPGSVRARWDYKRQRGIDAARIRGYWQDAAGGYSLELEIPLEYTGERLGFFIIDEDNRGARADRFVGNTARIDTSAPPWLIHHPQSLQQTLAAFAAEGLHVQVVDREGRQLADLAAKAAAQGGDSETFWLLRLLYRSVLAQDELASPPVSATPGSISGAEVTAALSGRSATERYREGGSATRSILSSAVPISDTRGVMGAVILRQSGETYLSLTDKAFSRLLGYSLLALSIGAVGLLAYATVLSLRIRHLSRSVSAAIAEDGRILDDYSRSRASDEIGDLSRQYGDLLKRLREYNEYLRTLSRKLSHELRTPIAVIQSSLDNLEGSDTATEKQTYLTRAREGLVRLQYILGAMSEANRLEESIRSQEPVPTDVVPLLQEVCEAYRGVYSDHQLVLSLEYDSAQVEAVPELLVQALDKLMDNAASFAAPHTDITLALQCDDAHWVIAVSNLGQGLAEGDSEKMFDPMVSLREAADDDVHLGLGLHIVRLIVDYHRGRVWAENMPDGRGVMVCIELPALAEVSSRRPAA